MTEKSGNLSMILVLLCATILSTTLSSRVYDQSGFEEAHTLLVQLDALQKSGRRDDATLDKLKQLVISAQKETRGFINKGILALLNSPGPHSSDEIRMKIAQALQVVPEYTPEVFTSPVTPSRLGSYVVAYNVSYCASCSNAWVGVIGKKGGRYDILSDLDDELTNKSLHVASIPPGEDRKNRFLIYGTNWGDAHNRLTVGAYMLDDKQLTKFWARVDLPQGTIKHSDNEITLKFLTKLEPPPTAERTEIYEIEPTRIKLKKEVERPI
jgi:hypothetical protein